MSHRTMTTSRAARRLALAAGLTAITLTAAATAADVTDWRTYRSGTANGTAPSLSGTGNDPIVGDLAGNPASAGVVLGYLDAPVTLGANVGDKITFSFTVHFNDASGLTPSGDNFRFALFDLNGEMKESATGGLNGGPTYATAGTDNTDQFRGFWLGNFGGGGAGNAGSIRQRSADLDSSDNPFTNNAANPAADIGTVSGDTVPLVSDVNGDGAGFDYTGTLTLTRAEEGLIDVSGTFVGTNIGDGETDNIFMSDSSVSGPSTYGAVSFLIGGPLSVDQALFTDVDVSEIPAGATQDADFDGDNDVDGADFLIWQRGLGTANAQNINGNADGDSDVDADDLTIWKSQFGQPQQRASVTAIPEPGALILTIAASLGGIAGRRRRVRCVSQW